MMHKAPHDMTPPRRRPATPTLWLGWCAVLLALAMPGCHSGSDDQTQRVEIAGRTFTLELALNEVARYRGLSGRANIPERGGMLFVFRSARELNFVMRDCLVPIDIIFLGPDGHITAMHAMAVEPPGTPEHALKRYSSNGPAQFAIELRGGTLPALGLKIGDRIELPFESLKARAR
jgi:uncharacterized membrane protein (UPF0127 family)